MPLVVRCMVNRGLTGKEEMSEYLYGTRENLHSPNRMRDMEKALAVLDEAKNNGKKVAIASDFDCDGIFSAYILWRAFGVLGMDAKIYTPDRVKEGYGLNRRIIEEALKDRRSVLVTCDNGIAANEEVACAREKGMAVIVTDHHEVQDMPEADAVLDPKREDDAYPFAGLCGAGVAFKLIDALYEKYGIAEKEKWLLLPYVAIATVADVMELRGENRILVREGLRMLQDVDNPGIQALLEIQGLKRKEITAGHIGFIIGPCFNAAGRISTVEDSFRLLMETDRDMAFNRAGHLKEINESRREMTDEGAERAFALVEEKRAGEKLPPVLVVLLPDVHESLVGIIAGRLKERYHHPAIVFTEVEEDCVKGSGRSIEAYDMFSGLMDCRELMLRFGGHKMAAGMTIRKQDLAELERRLCRDAGLTDEDFCPVVRIDAAMPIGFVTETLLEELARMEPFGVGNPKPVFAEQHFKVLRGRRLGRENTVLKLRVENEKGSQCDALLFHGADDFDAFVREEWGQAELSRMYEGRENHLDVALTYYPEVNEYGGRRTLQIQIIGYCRVGR